MKIMTHMHKKNNKKVMKRIIGITATVSILMAVVVAIIFFHLKRKPQVKFIETMTNTINSARNSSMNDKYGTFDMGMGMLNGSQNIYFADNASGVQISWKRNPDDHIFLTDIYGTDRKFDVFVNKKTSLVYVDDRAVRINYADNLVTTMSNSQVVSMLNLDNETIYSFGKAYENCMRMAANNFYDKDEKYADADIWEKTVRYFFSMEGKREGKEKVATGAGEEECRLYSVVFDVQDFYDYLDDCFGTHDMDVSDVYNTMEKYIPDVDNIDKMAELIHDIKQFTDKVLDGKNITFYFDVNSDGELVRLYADNISDDDMSVMLTFDGTDYTAQSYSIQLKDRLGRSLIIRKESTDEGSGMGVRYAVNIRNESSKLIDDVNAEVSVILSGDTAAFHVQIGDMEIDRTASIEKYEKGKSIDLKWQDQEDGELHIGCDPGKIEKPEYTDSIDLFDTDVISAYKFVREIMNR